VNCLRNYSARRRPAIVFFFGPNGAGKSIQMDLLIHALRERKIRVCKSWVASHHLFVWILGSLLAKLGYPKDHWTRVNPDLTPFADFSFLVKNMGKSSRLLLIVLETANLVVADLFKVRIPRLMGYWVVIEKYIPITIADMNLIYGREVLDSMIVRFLLRLIPKDAYGVFLQADYETLLERRGEKTEPRKYLEIQNAMGKWYAAYYQCVVIDTSKMDAKRTHELVMNYLNLSQVKTVPDRRF